MKIHPFGAAAAAALSLLLRGGALAQDEPADPTGHVLRVVNSEGVVSRVHFMENGVVHLTAGDEEITGAWTLAEEGLCLDWPDMEPECWPWDGSLQPGQPVSAVS